MVKEEEEEEEAEEEEEDQAALTRKMKKIQNNRSKTDIFENESLFVVFFLFYD